MDASQRSFITKVADLLNNPVHAIILAAAWLIYVLSARVDATQQDIKHALDDHSHTTQQIMQSQLEAMRSQLSMSRKICIGVNRTKPEICGDDK